MNHVYTASAYRAYPAYKDSGIEWLGEVPQAWQIHLFKRAYYVTLGKMLQPTATSPTDCLMPYLRAANIQWEGVDLTVVKSMWFSLQECRQLTLIDGDLLLSEGGDVGRSAIWHDELQPCFFQNSINRVRAKNGNLTRYAYYWMSVMKDKGYIDVLCNKSTIAHFTVEKVEAVPIPLPCISEQQAIAAFLDRETAKIDALIAKQNRLITLLNEKRQAVISHAVTQGLDPNVPVKDSGIEWLGFVPAHWECPALYMRYRIELGKMLDSERIVGDDLLPYLRNTDVQWNAINFDDLPKMDINSSEWNRYTICAGDLLVCEGGEVGRSAVVTSDAPHVGFQKALHRMRPRNQQEVTEFMYYTMYWAAHQAIFSVEGNQSTIVHLTGEKLRKYRFPKPPQAEQEAIVAFLDHATEKIDKLIEKAKQSIELMKERRSALIAAAVTGKIDVRELV